jgi:tyrocidine synthetase-3
LEFDASTFEIWGALLNSLTLYVVEKEKILNPGWLKNAIRSCGISIIWMTSLLFNHMLQTDIEIFEGLKNLLVGGDVLSPTHIGRLRSRYPRLKITNGYGPTENTTFSTTFSIDREYLLNIPIGDPIANSTAYIVDEYNHLQPIGVPGELLLGGDGVARGYLNNPELTAEKFVAHELHELHELNELKQIKNKSRENFHHSNLYRTGDLARWLNDGNIEFLGRIDNQIKIRGFRVELGEIELQLLSHDGIKTSVVLLMAENGENYLCAYFTADKEVEIAGLRDGLAKKLPHYMIPSYFNQIESMPLTTTGKLDRKTLASIGHKSNIEIEFVAPQNDTEKIVAAVWKEVLGIEQVGIYDNFFNIGGNSLRLITLNTKLNTVLGTNIPAAKLFEHVTISAFVRYYAGKETGGSPPGAIIDKSNTISDVKKSRERRKERRRANSND